MPFAFSPVADNSLLPFATPGSVAIPRGDDNVSGFIDISAIFEDGFLFGADRMNRLQIETNGQIQFTTVAGNQSATIALMFFDQDTRTLPPGVANAGIWLDYNTERDSVVITWNGVGQFSQMVEWPSTYQVEIRDLGDGDAEIIYRFNDLTYASPLYGSYFIYSYGLVNSPLPRMGTLDLWDDTPGNTGVTGVWQFRIEDGRVLAEDLTFPPQRLIGTAGDDSLTGGLGDDRLNGLGGNDTLTGGAGQDVIMGGDGDNRLYGGFANDTITAGDGDDYIDGGQHADLIGAGGGNDTILSAGGHDTIYGAGGDDLVVGTDNPHGILAYGGDGNDSIAGGRTGDTLYGEDGNDVLSAVSGRNLLDGGNGDDILSGGWDADVLYGGEGNDTLNGENTSQSFAWGSSDQLYGGAGEDNLFGAGGADWLYGGDDNDILNGGSGNDRLFGDDGDDFIFGAAGNDTATGGAGADRFFVSRNPQDSLHITDYNAAEGDRLVLDGTLFDADELRLITSRQQGLDGAPGTLSNLALVRLDEGGRIAQTMFTFDDPGSLNQLILRLPVLGGVGESLTIDLF
jgi:hypothetical protein